MAATSKMLNVRPRVLAGERRRGGTSLRSAAPALRKPAPRLRSFEERGAGGSVRPSLSLRAVSSYDAPSSVSGGTQLEQLSKLSFVVRNSLIIDDDDASGKSDAFGNAVCSSAAAVTSRILLKVLRNPVGMRQYEQPIESALAYVENTQPVEKDTLGLVHCSLDKAMVNLGSLLSEQVEGKVSTEVDARFAHDADKIVAQVTYLAKLYDEVGVSREKILYRIPATWAGIQAARTLEQRGLHTLMTLVCSFAQCMAAAEAGVSVVQLYVGRVRDWYKAHPNAIRNPDGPREDAGSSDPGKDPGHDLVTKCYNYLHKYHPHGTKIMAGDIRTKEDALHIAGCDYIALSPAIIKELELTPSSLGYNDGLSAVNSYPSDVEAALTPAKAQRATFTERQLRAAQSEADFDREMGDCGRDLLGKSLKRYCDSIDQLEPYFTKIAGRTN
mmetsp:Transcript_13758/g.35522  ORF Transcript_13758/g.35522 Transcript_13758/m.35522 type:complete len:442 (-) Transcript_13758:61-1386(-)